MITHAYSVFDRKALIYHKPFFEITDGTAMRAFADLANDTNSSVGVHPTDYVLFRIGSYDDQLGKLLPVSPLVHVADAIALVRQSSPLPIDRPQQRPNGSVAQE